MIVDAQYFMQAQPADLRMDSILLHEALLLLLVSHFNKYRQRL